MKPLLALILLAGCGIGPSLPHYMQDLPRSKDESLTIFEGIRKELGKDFQVDQVEDCFFVASNETAESLQLSKGTIERVYRCLYKDFFSRRPEKPIRIYLFKDKPTYEEYCRTTYHTPPSTPFGFYMPDERKIVMNIATGRGTLAHELVHPLLSEDFQGVPSWFNEGFASLYEQSAERDGKMIGLVNWRLPRLQGALRGDKGVALRDLLKTTSAEFYGDDRGIHYATARYLNLWLQEKGLLAPFYQEFRKGFRGDASGIASLEKTAGCTLEELDVTWREWALGLEYRD